ncbi:MAG: hypothetical protein WKG32_17500 [Gemmatimonadaceae bacterium]
MAPLHEHPTRRPLLFAAAAIILAAACDSPSEHEHGDGEPTAAQRQGVSQVQASLAHYQNLASAQAAGYTAQFPAGCAESAEGAQGFHYLNEGLVDTTVELLRPELVMYEPRADGSLQLIGVDYVVPLQASEQPPTLLGMPFMRNEPLGVWALHIWAWRQNPRGMFAAWNPAVSCANAR